MYLIKAVVRPEKRDEVLYELTSAGFNAATVVDVVGRGKQKGIKIGNIVYDEIPKVMIIMAVKDADKDDIVSVIMRAAKTSEKGAFGDGKIFVSPLEEAYTVSTGAKELQEAAMKEIIAVVRMNRTNATKKALIESGAAGFTALKVMGRGKLVEDKGVIAARKANMMEMAIGEDAKEAEELIDGFLDGQRLFPRRMFHVIAKNQDVDQIVQAIISANRTENKVGDGKIFVLPIAEVVRIRTAERNEVAL